MRNTIGQYLEQQILSANPLELVGLSYRVAINAVRDARAALKDNDVAERTRCISLSHAVIAELYSALDFKAGDGSLSRELGRLYEYMMKRLLAANFEQNDAILGEVLSLLSSLAESWNQILSTPAPKLQPAPPAPVLKAQQAQPSAPSRPWEIAIPTGESLYSLSF